ncbi:MAG: T9SS type A sorting domain-containing protein [Saprospiraceae bacterium]|nr:T9SS type A sorting domain-containing protein [Saprospiraceae bacterium]
MHAQNLSIRLLNLFLLWGIFLASVVNGYAQRSSEKHALVITGQATLIEDIADPNLINITVVSQVGSDYAVIVNNTTDEVSIAPGSTAVGQRSFTIEYVLNASPIPLPNYRIYYLNFVPSVVIANDDVVTWDGVSPLTLNPLGNDTYSGPVNIKINQSDASATLSVVNNQISYSRSGFTGPDYIQYTLTDSLGTADQGIIKIAQAQPTPTENQTINFVINYLAIKNITLPAGFNPLQSPFNGDLDPVNATRYIYTPAEYFIGQDSFSFENGAGTRITYKARIIDAERDPGFVKNDVVYTAKNTPVYFDVFANDMVDKFPITYYSPELVRDTLGKFTYTPPTNFSGTKNFTYKVSSGISIETGKITMLVGNFNPQQDIQYNFDIPSGKDFVLEYDVPISGYAFVIDPNKGPNHGNAYVYQDSTSGLSCGTAYGKALLSYDPDNGFTGLDTMELKYCVANTSNCITYKLRFNVFTAPNTTCPCIDDCVWSGDLNGDGRVSAQDLLTLGRYLGYEGPERDSANQASWAGSMGDEWGVSAVNGKDLKHADANGDGRLTAADAQSISDNFGKVSSLVPTENLGYKDFPFQLISNYNSVQPGDTLVIYFALGSQSIPANDVHGLSFGLSIDGSFVDSSSLKVTFFDNTWMTDHSPTLQMHKQVADGNVRLAFTRSGGKGTSGAGIIGQAIWIVGEEEADGVRSGNDYILRNIIVSDIALENEAGELFRLDDRAIKVKQLLRKNDEQETVAAVLAFPNPANDIITVLVPSGITKLEVLDLNGRILISKQSVSVLQELDLSSLNQGMYILRAGNQVVKLIRN